MIGRAAVGVNLNSAKLAAVPEVIYAPISLYHLIGVVWRLAVLIGPAGERLREFDAVPVVLMHKLSKHRIETVGK